MARRKDIDQLLRDWPYEPGSVSARLIEVGKGREVIQMRIEMGLLQMETTGRPDGAKPEGADTYFDYLLQQSLFEEDDFELSDEQCDEADREFVQFYHRRICWLSLREFSRAAQDADHTLAFMDFCREHAPDEQWAISHEQYRPFVLFHRVQAAALAQLEDDEAEQAISEINEGLERFRTLFEEYDAEERYDDDELVSRLIELRESLRDHYEVGQTLDEQLNDAITSEKYELAAALRDKISQRNAVGRGGPNPM